MLWTIDSLAGGSLLSAEPVFTHNERYFFVCQGVNIRMYDINTLKVVRTLTGHTKLVTLCQISKQNNLQMYSSSLDGTIRLWDIMDGKCIFVYHAPHDNSILSFEQHPLIGDHLFICMKDGQCDDENQLNSKWTVCEYSRMTQKTVRSIITGEGHCSVLKARAVGPMIDNISDMNDLPKVLPNTESIEEESSDSKNEENSRKRRRTDSVSESQKSNNQNKISIMSILALSSGKFLFIYNLATNVLLKFYNKLPITTIAIHPKENYIATGDVQGQILIWYLGETDSSAKKTLVKIMEGQKSIVNLDDSEEIQKEINTSDKMITSETDKSNQILSINVYTTILHWHAHGVNHIVFNPSGELLYSIGPEGVLVHWSMRTFEKGFLPRICDGLQFMAINNRGNMCVLTGCDNSLHVIDLFENKIVNVYRSIGLGALPNSSSCQQYIKCGILYDPNSQNICIPLPLPLPIFQVYDIHSDTEVYQVGSEGMNSATKSDGKRGSMRTINNYVFSHDGHILYILEKWNNGSGIESNILKFYHYNFTKQNELPHFDSELFAQIDNPHNDHITCMCIHPSSYILATGSKDGSFKIWKYMSITSENNTNESVVYKGNYTYSCVYENTYREQPVGSCCYSADGSILAVSYGSIVTLWRTEDMSLISTLSHPPPSYRINYLSFFNSNAFLLCVTDKSIFVYQIIAKQILWFVNTNVYTAASNANIHSDIPLFAVSLQDSKVKNQHIVAIYSPDSPVPLCGYKFTSKILALEWGFYTENSIQLPCLYALTSRKEILCFKQITNENDVDDKKLFELNVINIKNSSIIDLEDNSEETTTSVYDKIFSVDQIDKMTKQLKQQQDTQKIIADSKNFQQIISVPSHTLPIPSLLFQSYANQMLNQNH